MEKNQIPGLAFTHDNIFIFIARKKNGSLVKTFKTRFVKKGEKHMKIVDFTVQRCGFFLNQKIFS